MGGIGIYSGKNYNTLLSKILQGEIEERRFSKLKKEIRYSARYILGKSKRWYLESEIFWENILRGVMRWKRRGEGVYSREDDIHAGKILWRNNWRGRQKGSIFITWRYSKLVEWKTWDGIKLCRGEIMNKTRKKILENSLQERYAVA